MRSYLKKKREEKGLTVKNISKLLGISESFYYKIESGDRNPNINLARDIAKLLKENVDKLFFSQDMDEMSIKIEKGA